jgi:hypothetical protein
MQRRWQLHLRRPTQPGRDDMHAICRVVASITPDEGDQQTRGNIDEGLNPARWGEGVARHAALARSNATPAGNSTYCAKHTPW